VEIQLVVFELANEHYGVMIADVESIIKMQAITRMPQAPDFVEGVTNLRGNVLPVLDLRKRFNLPVSEHDRDTRIIVVSINGVTMGMIVDAVSEVLRVPQDSVEPPPLMVTTVNSSFITGIAKVNDKLIILLDLSKVLSIQESSDLQRIS
jgi:purine-binding chemotaxis protein CheW